MSDTAVQNIVDARGLRCPLPLIKTRHRAEALAPGDTLTLLATDPEAPLDVSAWCHDAGHELLAEHQSGDEWRLEILLR